jgi:hypothetical protein
MTLETNSHGPSIGESYQVPVNPQVSETPIPQTYCLYSQKQQRSMVNGPSIGEGTAGLGHGQYPKPIIACIPRIPGNDQWYALSNFGELLVKLVPS